MVRWFKLFRDQYIGFWVFGLVLFALQEIPYMVMPLFKLENNPIMNMQESSAVLNVCEKVLGSLCIAIMTFVVQEKCTFFHIGNGVCRVGFFLAVFVLILNYVGWSLYEYDSAIGRRYVLSCGKGIFGSCRYGNKTGNADAGSA